MSKTMTESFNNTDTEPFIDFGTDSQNHFQNLIGKLSSTSRKETAEIIKTYLLVEEPFSIHNPHFYHILKQLKTDNKVAQEAKVTKSQIEVGAE